MEGPQNFKRAMQGKYLEKQEYYTQTFVLFVVVDRRQNICYLIQLLCLANILEWFYKTGIIIQKKLLRYL